MHKTKWLYRKLFRRNGHGVHSPFGFHFITKVIEEKHPYYCYKDLRSLRQQLLKQTQPILVDNKPIAINKLIQQHSITPSVGELIFRIVNDVKPHSVLTIGSSFGFIPAYITAAGKQQSKCISLIENQAELEIANQINSKSCNRFQIIAGAYIDTYPSASNQLEDIDLICIESLNIQQYSILEQLMPTLQPHSVCILLNIRANKSSYQLWKKLSSQPQITVSFDLHSLGVLFLNPKLQPKQYRLAF